MPSTYCYISCWNVSDSSWTTLLLLIAGEGEDQESVLSIADLLLERYIKLRDGHICLLSLELNILRSPFILTVADCNLYRTLRMTNIWELDDVRKIAAELTGRLLPDVSLFPVSARFMITYIL